MLEKENLNEAQNPKLNTGAVNGSFYREIMDSSKKIFYGKLIKQYSNHEIGRIYYISKQYDGTLYTSDNRGIGQGGYVSNVIDSYFEKSSELEYVSQNYG